MHTTLNATICSISAAAMLVVPAIAEEVPIRPLPNYLSPKVEQILNEGKFELLSLDPSLLTKTQRRRLGPKLFHGYRVLGKTKIQKGTQRSELVAALQKAIADSEAHTVYCFEPRHGIRASVGKERVDLVICFQCDKIEIHGAEPSAVSVSATGQPAFDAALKGARIALGERLSESLLIGKWKSTGAIRRHKDGSETRTPLEPDDGDRVH